MKRIPLLSAALLLAVCLAFAFQIKGWTADSFIISNADATTTLGMSANASLNTLISEAGAHPVIEAANANRLYALSPAPEGLTSLLSQVPPRLVIQFANANRLHNLAPVPTGLADLIAQMPQRITLEFANANRFFRLAYPGGMMNDTLAPTLSNVKLILLAGGGARITWDTNEYATGAVQLGVSSGVYTQTASDTLVSKVHAVVFTGLSEGQKYYYQIQSTDRSGNLATHSELSFTYTEPKRVYVPYLRR